MNIFPPQACTAFAANYPEVPHRFAHSLHAHPLLELEALASLAEALPAASIEYNASDQPIGISGKPEASGVPIGETIRTIGSSGSWAALKNIEQDARYAALLEALLASDKPAEAYFEATLSGKKRKELRRQFTRLSELGDVRIERSTNADGLDIWIERFLALELAGWKGLAGSALAATPATAHMFRESLYGAALRGKLERLTLSLDGVPIAMLATFLAPPGAFSFKTTFDERYARYSPGVLLQRENLAILERSDIDWSDSCAAADHPMIDHIWRERRAIGRISIAIGGRLRRAAFSFLAKAEMGRRPTENAG